MGHGEIYFILTRNCNLKCSHCYLSAGPGKPSMSFNDFKKVIKHLPKKVNYMDLTGGEVFTKKKLLYNCLDFLQSINKKEKRKRFGIGVQTNGSWATNEKSAKSILNDLLNFGVGNIDVSSYDRYHAEQGLNQRKLKKLEKIIQEHGQKLEEFELRGAGYKRVMPYGRAGRLPAEHWRYKGNGYEMCDHGLDDYSLSIAEDGKVYLCCYDFFPLPGNVIHELLVDIVKKARKDELLSRINKEKVRGFAYYLGLSRKETTRGIKKYGTCGFCARLYLQNSKKLEERKEKR